MTKREFGIIKPLLIYLGNASEEQIVFQAPLDERTMDIFEEITDYYTDTE